MRLFLQIRKWEELIFTGLYPCHILPILTEDHEYLRVKLKNTVTVWFLVLHVKRASCIRQYLTEIPKKK